MQIANERVAAVMGSPIAQSPGRVKGVMPELHRLPRVHPAEDQQRSYAMVKRFYAFLFLGIIIWLAFEMATPRADFLP
ncbi:MAG: hypothetical protein J0H94_14250 [Rhizobiales bacterium]|nr:hypothetical protein [Hyphomicrobiales bacterium]